MTARSGDVDTRPQAPRARPYDGAGSRRLKWIAALIALAGAASLVWLTGYQIYVWSKAGIWLEMPAASFGLAWIGAKLNVSSLYLWATDPQDWIGIHAVLDWFSVGAALAMVCLVVAYVCIAWSNRV